MKCKWIRVYYITRRFRINFIIQRCHLYRFIKLIAYLGNRYYYWQYVLKLLLWTTQFLVIYCSRCQPSIISMDRIQINCISLQSYYSQFTYIYCITELLSCVFFRRVQCYYCESFKTKSENVNKHGLSRPCYLCFGAQLYKSI